jgi:hypothetical protein
VAFFSFPIAYILLIPYAIFSANYELAGEGGLSLVCIVAVGVILWFFTDDDEDDEDDGLLTCERAARTAATPWLPPLVAAREVQQNSGYPVSRLGRCFIASEIPKADHAARRQSRPPAEMPDFFGERAAANRVEAISVTKLAPGTPRDATPGSSERKAAERQERLR